MAFKGLLCESAIIRIAFQSSLMRSFRCLYFSFSWLKRGERRKERRDGQARESLPSEESTTVEEVLAIEIEMRVDGIEGHVNHCQSSGGLRGRTTTTHFGAPDSLDLRRIDELLVRIFEYAWPHDRHDWPACRARLIRVYEATDNQPRGAVTKSGTSYLVPLSIQAPG